MFEEKEYKFYFSDIHVGNQNMKFMQQKLEKNFAWKHNKSKYIKNFGNKPSIW